MSNPKFTDIEDHIAAIEAASCEYCGHDQDQRRRAEHAEARVAELEVKLAAKAEECKKLKELLKETEFGFERAMELLEQRSLKCSGSFAYGDHIGCGCELDKRGEE